MKRPKTFVDESGNERNGSDIQDAYERAMEDKRDEERELKHEHDNETNSADAK